jgi:hypothetical protein
MYLIVTWCDVDLASKLCKFASNFSSVIVGWCSLSRDDGICVFSSFLPFLFSYHFLTLASLTSNFNPLGIFAWFDLENC